MRTVCHCQYNAFSPTYILSNSYIIHTLYSLTLNALEVVGLPLNLTISAFLWLHMFSGSLLPSREHGLFPFSAPRSDQESFSASQICNSTASSVAAIICIDPFIATDPTFPSFSGTLGMAFLQEDVGGGGGYCQPKIILHTWMFTWDESWGYYSLKHNICEKMWKTFSLVTRIILLVGLLGKQRPHFWAPPFFRSHFVNSYIIKFYHRSWLFYSWVSTSMAHKSISVIKDICR